MLVSLLLYLRILLHRCAVEGLNTGLLIIISYLSVLSTLFKIISRVHCEEKKKQKTSALIEKVTKFVVTKQIRDFENSCSLIARKC